MSDDGRYGLTIIAFIGSVFSPYYAWAGHGDPEDHCAFNVALYGASGRRWAMTERRRPALARDASSLSIGPSRMSWNGSGLNIRFSERGAPLPRAVRGSVRLHPSAVFREPMTLDGPGRHIWRPIAPRARVEVTIDEPSCAWSGDAYFDTNWGAEPLERAFMAWDWSRAHQARDTLIYYDALRRDGTETNLALKAGADGRFETIEAPPRRDLGPTFWRMPRHPRLDAEGRVDRLVTLEDAPFYSRSMLSAQIDGRPAAVVHESLSLDRLTQPVVRAMLPFRMPRLFW